ncbi:IS110 family transposase [Bosea rubneri]|jgi:transposase|uniref:IS110 family transposase n=1 Tax=Bosea rubneri TaxID=3075434 RepID=A0ABU3SH64_9HYPH|nr:IS110 family transposase [Bosea sp. ZW T0_25]MDU0344031.1 IS110 family transposase [Bosea sp. ZW T0_25]
MECFVGLDVSVKTTSVCVMDAGGTIIREGKAESSPEAIAAFLSGCNGHYSRVGLEAGPLCQWLYAGLAKAGFPVICIETRHAQAVLSARPNKTDRNDARGIAQMMRVGLYRPVHVKTLASQKIRALLSGRRFLQAKLLDVENSIRGLLRNFGLKVGMVTRAGYEERILELIEDVPSLQTIIEPMLAVRQVIREQYARLHKKMLALARADDDCLLLMSAPGVGPLIALTYRAAIDEPARFQRSRSVGAHFGLAPRTHQSGEIDRRGRITKNGDETLRSALFEAALVLLRPQAKPSALKAWGLRVAKRRGMAKAMIAVARRLSVILHRMWIDRVPFRWTDEPVQA